MINSNWLRITIASSNEFSDENQLQQQDSNLKELKSIELSDIISIYEPVTIDSNQNESLCGCNIVCDPLLGHIIIFRKSNGAMGIINISIHLQLYELEANINNVSQNNDNRGESESKTSSKLEDLRNHAQDIILNNNLVELRKAITQIPKPNEDFHDFPVSFMIFLKFHIFCSFQLFYHNCLFDNY